MNRNMSFQNHADYVVAKWRKHVTSFSAYGTQNGAEEDALMPTKQRNGLCGPRLAAMALEVPDGLSTSAKLSAETDHGPNCCLSCGSPRHRSGESQLRAGVQTIFCHSQKKRLEVPASAPMTYGAKNQPDIVSRELEGREQTDQRLLDTVRSPLEPLPQLLAEPCSPHCQKMEVAPKVSLTKQKK